MNTSHEAMSPEFEKWHLMGLPFNAALHHFTGPDQAGPHDHPFAFQSHILSGGYLEEVWSQDEGGRWSATLIERLPGTTHHVAAACIHRIVELPRGDCWTLIVPGPTEREKRFWRFGDGQAASRAWHEPDFTTAT